jgi:hypothetical protein
LVDAHYRQDYLIWKWRLDANIRGTHFLVDHLRDPSGTIDYCRSIEASLSIPFVPTVRAAELSAGTDISSHIKASMTSYYLEITSKTLLTTE